MCSLQGETSGTVSGDDLDAFRHHAEVMKGAYGLCVRIECAQMDR